MFAPRIAQYGARRALVKRPLRSSRLLRQMSSSASAGLPLSQPMVNTSVLAGITTELDRLAPRIDIQADQVTILNSPVEFYETLKAKIKGAKHRIYLSTLYVGKSEHELVACLRKALQNNQGLKVSILTDALRGTRESPEASCASLLSPLVADFPDQVEVRMYHTPNLTGLRKRFIPKRINEGWGLQHMKLYGVDDEIILSGANLSNDYFTNRQDRYHVFSSKETSDYFAQIHNTMCNVSFLLYPGTSKDSYELKWPSGNASPSPLEDPRGYVRATAHLFKPLIAQGTATESQSASCDTALYPLLIIPKAVNTELPILESLLSKPFEPGSSYLFTAGYFNPHPGITASLLSCSRAGTNGTVLTASPWANGFYGSKGVSGMLPAAYTLLSRRFLQAVEKHAPGTVKLREWRQGTVGTPTGWTYHAKGLWLTLTSVESSMAAQKGTESPTPTKGEPGPSVTIIGSSNYTTRSYSLDTEVGAIVVTRNAQLKAQLKKEEDNLLKFSSPIGEEDLKGGDRRVGMRVRMAMWIVKAVGGSL